jgi:hypothetical protein
VFIIHIISDIVLWLCCVVCALKFLCALQIQAIEDCTNFDFSKEKTRHIVLQIEGVCPYLRRPCHCVAALMLAHSNHPQLLYAATAPVTLHKIYHH